MHYVKPHPITLTPRTSFLRSNARVLGENKLNEHTSTDIDKCEALIQEFDKIFRLDRKPEFILIWKLYLPESAIRVDILYFQV